MQGEVSQHSGGGVAAEPVSGEQPTNGGGSGADGAKSVEGSGSAVLTGDGKQDQAPPDSTVRAHSLLHVTAFVFDSEPNTSQVVPDPGTLSFTQDGSGGGADGSRSEEDSGSVAMRIDGQQDQPPPESTVPAFVQDTVATADSDCTTDRDQEEKKEGDDGVSAENINALVS